MLECVYPGDDELDNCKGHGCGEHGPEHPVDVAKSVASGKTVGSCSIEMLLNVSKRLEQETMSAASVSSCSSVHSESQPGSPCSSCSNGAGDYITPVSSPELSALTPVESDHVMHCCLAPNETKAVLSVRNLLN